MLDGIFDIHCHILYDVDDGAKNIKEAIQMIDMAYKDGIRNIIFTPHYQIGVYETPTELTQIKFDLFKTKIRKLYPDLMLYLGMEIFYHIDIVKKLEQNRIFTMAETSYLLVEFSPYDDINRILRGLRELQDAGLRPILAHIERYQCLKEKYDVIDSLIDSGVYVQVNASSIIGRRGRKTKKFTKKLLDYGMVHFIGTDAHSTEYRRPLLSECIKYIAKKWDTKYVRELFIENPTKLINNKHIR